MDTGGSRPAYPSVSWSLHEKAFTTNEDDPSYRELSTLQLSRREVWSAKWKFRSPIRCYRFRKDVDNGTLPAVSWLVPSERFSDHPSSPWYGAWYVAETLNILTKNPAVWSKTIFILTYDENDGYFDHVPPFVAPEPGNPESGKTSPGIDASLEYLPLEQDLKRHPGEGGARRSGGSGLSCAAHDRVAVEPRRICVFAGIRPYVGSSVARTRVESDGREKRSGRRTSVPGGGRYAAI